MERRIIARFQPQAWIGDYAINVDPQGATEWDVTDEIVAMGRAQALTLRDDQYETDDLRHSKNAPRWIAEWSGPFYVTVQDSIAAFARDWPTLDAVADFRQLFGEGGGVWAPPEARDFIESLGHSEDD